MTIKFLVKHVALFRPQKKTFHILEWSSEKGHWFPYSGTIHPNDIRLRKSLSHTDKSIQLPLRLRPINVTCSGKYLRVSNYEGRTVSRTIPICVKAPADTFPPSVLSYSTPYPTIPQIESHEKLLWIHQPVIVQPTSIPPRIVLALAREAHDKGEVCPISMEKITPETASITSCFHIFDGESIRRWLEKSTSCPVCKEVCSSYPTNG